MNYFQIDSVRSKIDQAFGRLERPDLRMIPTLGCCEDHEEDFAWYRRHSWQELTQQILTGWLDPVEFRSLHPVAYHYFVPGVLTATLESIGKDVGWHGFGGQDWLGNLIPFEDRAEGFRRDYLSRFNQDQIDAVVSQLELFQQALVETRGYPDDDLSFAINEVWKRNQ